MEAERQAGETAPPLKNSNKARMIKKRGQEAKRQALYRMSGADATQIDAIGVETAEVILSEYGPDLSRFPHEEEFISHAGLAPHVPSSGGKPLKRKKRNSASTRVATTLRMAAQSLQHSDTALGAYYRSVKRAKGPGIATFAAARRIGILIYRLLRWGHPYVDEGAEAYEKRYQLQRIRGLESRAKQLGYQLAPLPA
jgi:transposase